MFILEKKKILGKYFRGFFHIFMGFVKYLVVVDSTRL